MLLTRRKILSPQRKFLMQTTDGSGVALEVKNLSFVRTFSKGSWFTTMYSPPLTAQFLNEVTFRVNHGEVHGVMGSAGSGKSTLLDVIAGRIAGNVSGEISLNGQPLTNERFTSLCGSVNFGVHLLEFLTVEQTVRFHSQLSLNCNAEAIAHRGSTLMQQFDLTLHSQRLVSDLTESARRRLVLVLHLIKDPVLILVDDALLDLDALSNYQLISSLREHVRRYSRMAIVTMRCPRSDVYQLLGQLTLLFYGEVVYSGPSRFMPHYFSQIGYRCPITENPAVYYLSLATVDRETPESYAETQSKAANLVDVFKKRRSALDLSAYVQQLPSDTPVLSCYFGAPTQSRRFWVLVSRNLLVFIRSYSTIFAQFILLIAILFVASFGGRFYSNDKHSPQSSAGTIFALNFFTALSSTFCTSFTFKHLRHVMFWEVSESLYNAVLMLLAFIASSAILDLFSIILSAISFIWIVYPAFTAQNLITLILSISCTYLCYKLLVLALYTLMTDCHKVLITAILFASVSSTIAGGFLKSYQSFTSTNEILTYAATLSTDRFANLILFHEFLNQTRIPSCRRKEQQAFAKTDEFCRWQSGTDYLAEVLPEPLRPIEQWQGIFIVALGLLVTSVFFVFLTVKRAQIFCNR